MLLHHIRRLESKALAKITYEEQWAKKWPGLAREGEEICNELEIESVHSSGLEKQEFRTVVTNACHKLNEKRIRKHAEGKEKCTRILNESYGKKNYLQDENITEVRNFYRTRFGLLPFAGNYSHDKKYARTNWLCRCNNAREVESHLTGGNCTLYNDIREKYGKLENDSELVNFFQEILERREEMDEAEEAGRNSDNALVVGPDQTLPDVPAPALGQEQARY